MSTEDPNLPWLGRIPGEWRVERARFLFREEARLPDEQDGVVTAFRDGQVTLRENRRTDGFTIAIKETGYQGLRRGDLVILSMDAFAGAVGVSESDGKCTGEYAVCNPTGQGFDNRYYAHVLREMARQGYIYVICPSVRERAPRFRYVRFQDVHLPVPPANVQKSIADFLDRKTAAIDALIEKKQKLLALLAEKRAALINQAVTKGLDPSVPMKDSGIPWIGEIPAHWQVHRLRRVVRTFVDYRGRTPEKSDEGIPLTTAGAVRDGKVDHGRAPEWVTEEVYADLVTRGRPEVGDLLFTSEAPLGEVGLIEDPNVACAQRIIMFKVERKRMDSAFLLLHFLSASGRGEIWSRASGSTAEGIRADRLKMSLVPTPPLPEQALIATFVAEGTSGFGEISAAVERQLERLQEYRQALITAAVTGQLDITGEDAA